MKKWIFITLGLIVIGGVIAYFLINMDFKSETAKSDKGLTSVKVAGRAPCTPAEIASLAKQQAAGSLRLPYPCSTAGVSLDPLDPLSPEFRLAAQIGGVQPYINRETCYSYARAALKADYDIAAKRDKFENEICGWRRGRPGCPYADRFRDYNA